MTLVVGDDFNSSTSLNTVHVSQPKLPPYRKWLEWLTQRKNKWYQDL